MDLSTSSAREEADTAPVKRRLRKLVLPDMPEEEYYSPVKNENNDPNPKDESPEDKLDSLSQFSFQKKGQGSQRITRSASRKLQDQNPQQNSDEKTPTLDDIEELEKDLEEKETRKKKVVSHKTKRKSDTDSMPPPKEKNRTSSTKRKSDPSDNKKIKDELKERQIEEVSLYLFNYLKDTHTNTVNKTSLKKILRGLLIDNITEEQADIMLNYPNLDTKDFQKDHLTLDDLKLLVRECSFKFGPDGNLL